MLASTNLSWSLSEQIILHGLRYPCLHFSKLMSLAADQWRMLVKNEGGNRVSHARLVSQWCHLREGGTVVVT